MVIVVISVVHLLLLSAGGIGIGSSGGAVVCILTGVIY